LTIASLENDVVGVTIIPHTFQHTSLGSAGVGSKVNVEVDVLAKHVEKLLGARSLD
jgi:riboflavin synthase